jgi:hypothetical protein
MLKGSSFVSLGRFRKSDDFGTIFLDKGSFLIEFWIHVRGAAGLPGTFLMSSL